MGQLPSWSIGVLRRFGSMGASNCDMSVFGPFYGKIVASEGSGS